ncbi:MAG: 1-acyl-sn-glycerol-3-phosphate acyltransferase [Clostridia bacterium]|nr:1-acyl-sn-glycerol-3-phosphate acyltransferase [Clostridia bacterium]
MKIKTRTTTIEKALALPRPKHKNPKRPNMLWRMLIRLLSFFDLRATGFSYTKHHMEKAGKGPCLILMNHSSFIDMEIASTIFFPKPLSIVCTTDGMVGKAWLMRQIGCIPTQKFVSDITLIRDMMVALHQKKSNVLMFPEAGYSLDGTATPLPRRMGVLLKKLNVPVITVKTEGAFLRDPLYNCLQKRKAKVSARVECLFSREEIETHSVEELDRALDEVFTYDHFAAQKEKRVKITEPFRADGLHRILYRCAACSTEGQMEGKGVTLTCHACGKTYEMDEYGSLCAREGETELSHIPAWNAWQRACVRREIEEGSYRLDVPVRLALLVDYHALYMVGEGRLVHDQSGFSLYDERGELIYTQSPIASHSLNADYYWYEIGDVISIGNRNQLFYCFPQEGVSVSKARLAAEELYRLCKPEQK